MQVAIVDVLWGALSPSVNYLKGLEPPRGTMARVECVWDTKIMCGTLHQALLAILRQCQAEWMPPVSGIIEGDAATVQGCLIWRDGP